MKDLFGNITKGAMFSDCRKYRYMLSLTCFFKGHKYEIKRIEGRFANHTYLECERCGGDSMYIGCESKLTESIHPQIQQKFFLSEGKWKIETK